MYLAIVNDCEIKNRIAATNFVRTSGRRVGGQKNNWSDAGPGRHFLVCFGLFQGLLGCFRVFECPNTYSLL